MSTNSTSSDGPLPFVCDTSYDVFIEAVKYFVQFTYLLLNVFLNFSLLVLFSANFNYRANPFYIIYAADLAVGIYMAISDILIGRLFSYITPLCPIISPFFFEPSIFLKIYFTLTHYTTGFKTISQVFLSLNRMSCVVFPISHEQVWKKITFPCLFLLFFLPFGIIWNILLSRVYANPSGGGFSANYIRAVSWASVSRFHLIYFIISLILIVIFSITTLYFLFIRKIRLKSAERSITLASLAISIEFMILAGFQIYFAFFSSTTSPYRPYLLKALDFTYDSLNFFPPLILIIMNPQIRSDIFKKLKRNGERERISVASRSISTVVSIPQR